MGMQLDWRFCQKCHVMFFDGYPDKGQCGATGAHVAQGYMFALPHDIPPAPQSQDAWRYCGKCHAMFYDGYPDKGRCDAGDLVVAGAGRPRDRDGAHVAGQPLSGDVAEPHRTGEAHDPLVAGAIRQQPEQLAAKPAAHAWWAAPPFSALTPALPSAA
jgi:hypothetical protein